MTRPDIPPMLPTVDEAIAWSRIDVNNSDTGNAKRFVNRFGEIMRYVALDDMWYVWVGTHWEPDVRGLKAYALTEAVVQMIRDEAESLSNEPPPGGGMSERDRMAAHALKTESEGARRRMLSVATSDSRVILTQEGFNAAHNLLACPNGTVDLDTGDLIPSLAEHLNTACCSVPYDEKAKSKDLEKYLETFMPDEEDQAVLFGVLGTALRGGNAARLMPMFLGPSTSGKSQIVEAVANLLRGYATSINVSVFRGTLDDKPRPDLIRAMYTRVAYASEAARSWELHADQVKRLTGGDKIPLRDLYSRVVEADPLFTPFIIANEMPRVKGADDAFRRRMLIVRFNHALLPGLEDTRLKRRFVSDVQCLQALLARMVIGARSPLFINGVNWSLLPERFALALMDAFDEVDHVGSFLLWMSEQGYLHQVDIDAEIVASRCAKAADLHSWYGYWITKHGDRADREGKLNLADFGKALRTRGWESRKVAGTRWLGWTLATDMSFL